MIDPNFVILGVLLQGAGGVRYLVEVLRGRVQPNRVTWFLWALAPLVAFAGQLSEGVGIQALTTFIVGFVPLVIFLASFANRQAAWQLTGLDWTCGALSLAGLALWAATREGTVAIVFAMVADGLAAVPTLVKAYREPESENDAVFVLGVANAAIGLLATHTWTFEHAGFPAYLLLLNALLAAVIHFRLGPRLAGVEARG